MGGNGSGGSARNQRTIATGRGVVVGNVDADTLAGNFNMIRPDGQHVIIDAPDPHENVYSDEFNGDVSSIAAQGTVIYTYASQLPYSNVPAKCSFRIVGDATGASILTTGYFTYTNSLGQVVAPESQVIAGLQQAVNEGVNVVSESYGYGALPGANDDLVAPTNVAMWQAGVVVVESAGDSGSSGTVEAPADNPDGVDVGGTNDLRLLAQADGYTKGWEDDNVTTLSSGGTTPLGDVVDLVAPGYGALAVAGIWANGRGHVQSPPDTPGPYTGTVTFQASGQNFTASPASAPVTIAARSWASVPLSIALPRAPGDAPESVQFTGPGGLESSVPIARRTLIPSAGGSFGATLTSSVSRGPGQIKTFYVNVPRGKRDLDVSFYAPDHAADDPVYYYLFSPADLTSTNVTSGYLEVTATDTTPTSGNPTGSASLIAPDPQAGLWEIDVMQGATTDGTRFSQTVTGDLAYNQLKPVTATGLPTSTSTIIDSGSSVPITVKVTNTTNHAGYFELQPSNNDITGGDTVTPEELAPGTTGTLKATLSPTAAAGTAVHGTLSVIDSTDFGATEPAIGFPASYSDFHDFAYAYTVGS